MKIRLTDHVVHMKAFFSAGLPCCVLTEIYIFTTIIKKQVTSKKQKQK
jgi:hypothetical protein